MAKKRKMSQKEEEIQRALGTLPKFEVSVERDIRRKAFARVFVSAADAKSAEERAIKIVNAEEKDDTGNPVAWAENSESINSEPDIEQVRELKEDDHMIHRFNKNRTSNKDEDEDKIDASLVGNPI